MTTLDTGGTEQITVTFTEVVIVVTRPDGLTCELAEPGIAEPGTTIAVRTGPRTKTFKLGEQVVLTYEEIQFALFSHQNYVNNMTMSLQKYAESLGIKFSPEQPT